MMNLDQYSPEEIKEMSMLELATVIFHTKKEAIAFKDLVDQVSKTLGLTKKDLAERIAQFYTDLNFDGRFISLGENRWGLRSWYPYEQIDEEVPVVVKPKKKKGKKKVDEDDLDLVDFDELDEDDLEFDDIDDLDDDDDDDDDDLDIDIDDDDDDDDDDDLLEDDLEVDDLDEDLDEDLEDDDDLDVDDLDEDDDEK